MPSTIIALLTVSLSAPPEMAERDAVHDLLQDAAAACQLDSVRYTIEQRGIGDPAVVLPHVKGTITQQRADVPDAGHGGGKYRAAGEITRPDGSKTPFAWSYDGQTLRVLDPALRIVAIVDNPNESDAGRMLGFETGLLPFSQFLKGDWWRQLLANADAFALEAAAEVHGVKCDVISVTQTVTAPDGTSIKGQSRWSFGHDDHLPRAFETTAMRREITQLDINPALTDADFTFKVPEGYQEKRVLARAADMAGLLEVGRPAPAFTLKTPEGEQVSLDDLKGKVVVLDFWATWCGPCKRGMPGIQRLREKFAENDVAIFGISIKEKKDADPGGSPRAQLSSGKPLS